MALLLRGGNRSGQHSTSAGFALPTILISSVVMLIVLLVSISSTTAVRTSILNQYYSQLAQAAGDAGVAYAQACMNATGGVALWTDAQPLTPSTDCSGNSAANPQARVLVVAGGGGGGSDMGGGGGAGGVLSNDQFTLAVQTYPVTVGTGGAGAPPGISQPRGVSGGNSIFSTFTAIGGGGGGSEYANNGSPPANGGSGGGSAGCLQTTISTGTAGQGYGGAFGGCYYPSGGGGAGGPGAVNPGNGGPGIMNNILGTPYFWGGGGGGSGYTNFGGNGGNGGGGGGAIGVTTGGVGLNNGLPGTNGNVIQQANVPGGNAGANTGGGGGGGSHYNINNRGGNGGSGIVVISYPTGGITATGGTITTSGTNTIHSFTGSGSFVVTAVNTYSCPTDPRCSVTLNGNVRSSFSVPAPVLASTVRALVVAGGGSGGGSTGGGGGAGGVIDTSDISLGVTSYPVIVGTGGTATSQQTPGINGTNSSFNNLTAIGGGGGGYSSPTVAGSGQNGGSGGGGQNYFSIGNPGSGTIGQGNSGGTYGNGSAGGGGGAGSGGSISPTLNLGGRGGNGIRSNISGLDVFYGGGGGGGNTGVGGLGGGGTSVSSTAGGPGLANSGGGGAGGFNYSGGSGGAGGSGVVIIRYPTGSMTATGGTITISGTDTVHMFNASGTFVVTSVITKKVIANTGFVEVLRSSTGAVWRTYNQPASQPAVVSDLCSGATGSVYGWTNAILRTPSYSIPDSSAKGIGVSSTTVIAGPAYFRKDFSVTTAGNYVLTSAGDANIEWRINGVFVAALNSTTPTTVIVPLTAGCHTLVAKATNETALPDSSDIEASLKLSGAASPIVVTDASWRVATGAQMHYSSANYYESPTAWQSVIDIRAATAASASWTTQTNNSSARFVSPAQDFNYAGVAGGSPNASWTNVRDGKKVTVAANTNVRVGAVCDDNCVVYLNGQVIISSALWASVATTTVTLTPGTHQFGVALYNGGVVSNPSGFALAVTRLSDNATLTISDLSWRGANYWSPADQNPSSYDATFVPNPRVLPDVNTNVLVVGGGGGGGSDMGGGGGGGGVVFETNYNVSFRSPVSVTVGAGGTGAPPGISQPRGQNGANSVFGSLTAIGGGGGGSEYANNNSIPSNGGSGGGSAGCNQNTVGEGIIGQGFRGGLTPGCYWPTGGGGAGGVGLANPGHGGVGVSNSILGIAYFWGGGGGGSGYTGIGGNGGNGGGGGGAIGVTTGGSGLNAGSPGTNGCTVCQANVPGGNAGANTGGGGGGGAHYNSNNRGGNGGSGIVVISYPIGLVTATGGTITTSGGNTIHTFTSSGTFIVTAIP